MARKKNPPPTRLEALTLRINQWSRGARIGMNTFITLIVVVLVGYVVDRLILNAVYEERLSVWVPTAVVTVVGLATYTGGWYLLVGYDWDAQRPWRARRATTIFVLVGMFCFGVTVLGLIIGLVFGMVL